MPLSFGVSKGIILQQGQSVASPMILEIDTSLSSGTTFDLNFFTPSGGVSPQYTIDWGDGTVETFTSIGTKSRTYASEGTYQIQISGSVGGIGWGGDTATRTNNNKLTKIINWGDITGLTSLAGFANQSRLTEIPSNIPSSVVDLFYMFFNASTFNLDISSWDTSNVTNMGGMFYLAASFNQNVGSWDVSKVNNFGGMFLAASAFNNGGSSDINNWQITTSTTANVSFASMFQSAGSFNQPIGSWNTSRVNNIGAMFLSAAAFNQDIGSWDVSRITSLAYTFKDASAFNNGGSDSIKNWALTNNTSLLETFKRAAAFNQPIGSWDTSNVTNMIRTFETMGFNQDISAWNTAKVVDFSLMFYQNGAFNQDISGWNTAAATTMQGMFLFANSFNQNLGSWTLHPNVNLTSIFNTFVDFGLSVENYSKTLIGWANQVSDTGAPTGRNLGASGKLYNDITYIGTPYTDAMAAREYLTTPIAEGGAGWTITDDGRKGISFAYSLRSLNPEYTAGLIRVRRSSDDAEDDFTQIEIEDGTLTTWIGAGNDGFVKTWYDQSGNNNHATQTTTTLQPKIVNSGTLITSELKPAIEFGPNGDQALPLTTKITNARTAVILLQRAATAAQFTFMLGDSTGGTTASYHPGEFNGAILSNAYAPTAVKNGAHTLNGQSVNLTATSINSTERRLLTLINTSSSGVIGNIGQDRNYTNRGWRGTMQEIVVYNTDESASISTMISEVQNYYNIIVNDGLMAYFDASNSVSYPRTGTIWEDISGNARDVTLQGDPTYEVDAQGRGYFTLDGTGDYLTSVSLPNPNGELTLEIEMDYNNTGAYHNIFEIQSATRPMLWIDSTGKLEASFPSGSGGVTSPISYAGSKIVVAAVYDSILSPGVRLYVNGQLVGSNSTIHPSWNNPSTFTLFNRGGASSFNGKVYSVKFYDKALTPEEIQQNYVAITGKTLSNSLVINLDASDSNSYPGTGTAWTNLSSNGAYSPTLINGTTFTSDDGGALVFDGADDGAQFSTFPNIFQSSVALEGWFYFDEEGRDIFLGNFSIGPSTNFEKSTNRTLRLYWNGGQVNAFTPQNVVNLNDWNHIVIQRNVLANVCQFYVNGSLVHTHTGVGSNITASQTYYIGRDTRSNDGTPLKGKISTLKLYDRALTPEEIVSNYNSTAETFLELVLDLDASDSNSYPGTGTTWFDLSNSANNGTLLNGVTYSADNSGVLSLNGTNQSVLGDSNVSEIVGDPNLSMGGWFYLNSIPSDYVALLNIDGATSTLNGLSITIFQGRPAIDFWNVRVRATSALSTGVWYHIVVTKSAGDVSSNSKVYVNGVEVAATLEGNNGTPNITAGKWVVGRLNNIPSRHFNGKIGDVFISTKTLVAGDVLNLFNSTKQRFGY